MIAEPESFAMPCPRGFSLSVASRFVEFFPAAQGGGGAGLELAFPVERSWHPVGVRLRQRHSVLHARITHNDAGTPARQVMDNVVRILNLRPGGSDAIAKACRQDPVVDALNRHFDGLRPVQFHTPYEAAVWAILSQRMGMRQAAALKARLAAGHGTPMGFHDAGVLWSFPGPEELLGLGPFPGLTAKKLGYLQRTAQAALAGELDTAALLAAPAAESLQRLQAISGIGPFSAELILIRGAGHPDLLPRCEPRLFRALQLLYGITTDHQMESIAQRWRPVRSWVAVLARTWLEKGQPPLDGLRAPVPA